MTAKHAGATPGAERRRAGCWSRCPSGARASLTGPRADPEVHRDAAITCPPRLDATGINAGSGPKQPETVGKAPRDSAYPTTRTGPKRCLQGPTCRPQDGGGMHGRDRSGCRSCRAASELSRTLSAALRDRDGGRQWPGARADPTYRTSEGKGLSISPYAYCTSCKKPSCVLEHPNVNFETQR